jgi:hypothetical protein
MQKTTPTCTLLCFAFLILFPSIVSPIVYQIPPADIPQGLPAQIKGKYRIIEHDRSRKYWYVYDVNKWKQFVEQQFGEEKIRMYPPIHQHLFMTGSWQHDVVNEPMENTFASELVTIIDRDKPLKQTPAEGKQLGAKEAEAIVKKAFYPVNKHLWSFASAEYKGGVLVCSFSQYFPDAIGIWWAKGNKVYNVNGIARSKTKTFELTFDPNINVVEALNTCKSYR